ncbi:MAG: T9SS type A sorting domain-containing protein [Candidatus Eisenbacteria bacterium]|nr:T9SS type A sorting domain-containing protein [Candidatus Eisenbacteria bacterium]
MGWTTINEAQGVDDGARVAILLLDHSPNPISTAATVSFVMAAGGSAHLTIHDLSGRTVSTLANGTYGPGMHHVTWDISRDDGIPSGIYFCRLAVDAMSATRTMVVAR